MLKILSYTNNPFTIIVSSNNANIYGIIDRGAYVNIIHQDVLLNDIVINKTFFDYVFCYREKKLIFLVKYITFQSKSFGLHTSSMLT